MCVIYLSLCRLSVAGQGKQCVVIVFVVVLLRFSCCSHTIVFSVPCYLIFSWQRAHLPPLQVHTIESAVAASTSRE